MVKFLLWIAVFVHNDKIKLVWHAIFSVIGYTPKKSDVRVPPFDVVKMRASDMDIKSQSYPIAIFPPSLRHIVLQCHVPVWRWIKGDLCGGSLPPGTREGRNHPAKYRIPSEGLQRGRSDVWPPTKRAACFDRRIDRNFISISLITIRWLVWRCRPLGAIYRTSVNDWKSCYCSCRPKGYEWVLYRYVGFYSSLGCIVRWVRGGSYCASRRSINAGGGVNEMSRWTDSVCVRV